MVIQVWVHCDHKPLQIGLNHDYNMTNQFHLSHVSIKH